LTHPLTTATFAGVTLWARTAVGLPGITERAEAARMQRWWLREWVRERCLSEHPPRPALWGEPHPGFRGTGARFEEILGVTDSADPEESSFECGDCGECGAGRRRGDCAGDFSGRA
jgi:hypothetical protein